MSIDPEPPSAFVHMLAVCLEVGILSRLLAQGDGVGLAMCAAYAWWSATFAMLARLGRTP